MDKPFVLNLRLNLLFNIADVYTYVDDDNLTFPMIEFCSIYNFAEEFHGKVLSYNRLPSNPKPKQLAISMSFIFKNRYDLNGFAKKISS